MSLAERNTLASPTLPPGGERMRATVAAVPGVPDARRGSIDAVLPTRHAGTRKLRVAYELAGPAGAPDPAPWPRGVAAAGARLLGRGLWKGGDMGLIDGVVINGGARMVGLLASLVRLAQTGHVYWYALVMLLGVFGLLTWQLWPALSGLAGR